MDRSLLRLDLNMLKGLFVLLEERNVSRAAERLFLTPSAMNKMLHRLRDALDDELLVRANGRLVPTKRAEAIAVQLREAFAHIENVIAPSDFDPATARGLLRIASPETFGIAIMPDLIPVLRDAAPGLEIESLQLGENYLERLADDALDFVIYVDQEYPDGYVTQALFRSEPRVWCRPDHPITRAADITLEDICRYPKITAESPSIKLTELEHYMAMLDHSGYDHDVLFKTSHLLMGLVMLNNSDALMLAPHYLFAHAIFASAATSLPFRHLSPFGNLHIDLCLIQHQRTARSPLHRWVTGEILDTVARIAGATAGSQGWEGATNAA